MRGPSEIPKKNAKDPKKNAKERKKKMTGVTRLNREHIVGQATFDDAGEKVGYVEFCYLDIDTEQPEWAAVNNGQLASKSHLVPLVDAAMTREGLQLAFSRSQIGGAPELDLTVDLDGDDEAQLCDYYGLEYSRAESDTGLPARPTTIAVDDEVATVPREAGRARLRKHVVTETATTTIPPQYDTELVLGTRAVPDQRLRVETVTSDEEIVVDRRDEQIDVEEL